MQVIQESFEYDFIPTGVFVATWDSVLYFYDYDYYYLYVVSVTKSLSHVRIIASPHYRQTQASNVY